MSREVKFRAWSEEHKQMYTGIGPFVGQASGVADHMPLMQFTGLRDKNGKEIYEGDLIQTKQKDITFEVYWGDNDYQPEIVGWSVRTKGYSHPMDKACSTMIVIGNVHENPELVK